MMKTLPTLFLLLCIASVTLAEKPPRFMDLQHIDAEDAVTQAQAALGKEITDVTIVADARSNRVYLFHENPEVIELLEQFLLAIDLPGKAVGMTVLVLNYIVAEDALAAANKAFGKELEGARAVLCKKSNRILIGGPTVGRHKLETFLLALDRQPRQIQVRTVITRVVRDEQGREVRTVLSQPTITVADGKQGVIMSGANPGESLQVQITATILDQAGRKKGD